MSYKNIQHHLNYFHCIFYLKILKESIYEKVFDVVEVGVFGPGRFIPTEELKAGDVGYLTASIKNVRDTQISMYGNLANDFQEWNQNKIQQQMDLEQNKANQNLQLTLATI